MKKVCFIIPSLKAGGGSERIIAELANYASSQSTLEVHLILLIKDNRFYQLQDSIIVHEPSFYHKEYNRAVFTFKILRFLRKQVKTIKPDVVLSFEELYNSFVLMALLFTKVKVFVSDRSQPNRNWGITHKILKRILYPTSFGIIAQTEIAKKLFYKQTHHNNITVIPNPIRSIYGASAKKENIILNVGRLVRSKQQDLLIEIFSKVNYENWKLVIAGDGPEKDKLLRQCKDLGINGNIILTGNVENIDDYYKKSRIFAFTSNSEGFPNALGEAMASADAVISFDCTAGPSELIEDGINGYLIKENDFETYRIKLQELMDNDALCEKFGQKAKRKTSQYSIEIIGKRYLDTLLK